MTFKVSTSKAANALVVVRITRKNPQRMLILTGRNIVQTRSFENSSAVLPNLEASKNPWEAPRFRNSI